MSTQLVVATKYRKSRVNGKFVEPYVELETRTYDPAYIEDQNQFTDENGVFYIVNEEKTKAHREAVEKNSLARAERLAMSGISADALAKALVGNMQKEEPKGKPGRKPKQESEDDSEKEE
ncbi:MAG: hypothetical protein ACKO96_41175 [Flammeovirgaceae bacterium]